MLKERLSRLQPFFESSQADAILITSIPNIRYLSGFTGSDAVLLITPDKSFFLCDSRYTAQASTQTEQFEVVEFKTKKDAISGIVTTEKLARIACEGDSVTVGEFRELEASLKDSELLLLDKPLAQIRAIKDDVELATLRKSASLASNAFVAIMQMISPGVSEQALSLELEWEMRKKGAESRAFDFIIASGVRGAMPHGVASDKLLRLGEMITFDYGMMLDGYHSDETVTLTLGVPQPEMARIYDIVKDAHDMAIDAIKPGVSCRDIDAVARNHIAEKGYAEFFGHGLGHGVGLEIHEKPVISLRSDAVIEVGMVFTIEPGIYIPKLGGVRIEDTVAVTADGCEIITKIPKKLMQI